MKKIILQIFLFLLFADAFAQQAFTNNGNLQVHPGTSVTGFGNFTNTSSAALVNNGSFYLKQDVTNDQAAMAVGSGTLYLNGSIAQAVNGTQVFKTYDLTSNNSNGINLNNNLSVSNAHTFTAGLITTSVTPNYLVYETGSSYSGDGDSRHVNGWVKKYGTTDFVFPVGDATYVRKAGVTNLSANSEINCKYYTPTTNINNLASPLVSVDQNEYWQIDKVSGGNAQIALNWDNGKVAFPNVAISSVVVAHYTGGLWTNVGGSATGNVTTTGNITSNAVTSFSPFTFGFTSFALPLNLINFTAQRRTGTTYVHWITESEQKVSHFEIQRSNNTVNFSTIGSVTARNLNYQQHYDFEDHFAIQGIAYYRLKSVDDDGKFVYSKIVAVSENEFQSSSFLVINPVRNTITIFNKSGHDGTFEYRLLNASGQTVMNGNINMMVNGGAAISLPASISAGIYLLDLKDDKVSFRQKLLIQQ